MNSIAQNSLTDAAVKFGWLIDERPGGWLLSRNDEWIVIVFDGRGSVDRAVQWKHGQVAEVILSGQHRRRRVFGWMRG